MKFEASNCFIRGWVVLYIKRKFTIKGVKTNMAEFSLEKPPISMKEFYREFGLKDYPFNVFTAENETDYARDIFVHPQTMI